MCDRIDATLARMVETTALLLRTEPEFRRLFNEQRMFCLPHFPRAAGQGAAKSSTKSAMRTFVRDAFAVVSATRRNWGDVSRFCKKFDYRYEKED